MEFKRDYKLQFSGGNKEYKRPKQAYIAVPMSWVKDNDLSQGDILTLSWKRGEIVLTLTKK